MKKLVKVLLGAALAITLLAGPAISYDKEIPNPMPIETNWEASFSYPVVTALGTALGLTLTRSTATFEIKEGFWAQRGSGVIVAPGYVLTNWHVVNARRIDLAENKVSTRQTDPIAQTSRTAYIVDYKGTPILCKVIYEDQEVDVALLKFDAKGYPWLKPIKYLVGYDPSGLKAGDAVAAVLHERSTGECDRGSLEDSLRLRTGKIMSPDPVGPPSATAAWLSPFDITLTMVIEGGDSGSPLFVFKDGIPILIGLVRAYSFDHMWYASYAAQFPTVWKLVSAARGESLYNRYEQYGIRSEQ